MAASDPADPKKQPASEASDLPTVVVVDDSSTIRAIIQKELEEAGYRVHTFSDGIEALSSLSWMEKPPDLITLDIDMPRMDGFVCCEKFREQENKGLYGLQENRTPVLFISANDSLDNRIRGFHLGSLEFISKPFTRGDIARAVDRVLRPVPAFAGMTALIIDDSRSLRRMVSSCLERLGMTIMEAENGREAFDLLKRNLGRIDLAIVDFDMPVMRGDEFIHLARRLPEAEHLPLISLSSHSEPEAILQAFRAGATDYLIKPFINEELQARIQVHLQLRRHMRQLEEMNKNLYEKAVNDALTGLRNKRYFQEAFEEAFSRALRAKLALSCLFFDLDCFKKVNDTCGHGFGDYVLKTLGALVKDNIRRGDLAARVGGEEFVIVLPSTNLNNALIVAEKIRSLVANHPFRDQGQSWPVTISMGVAALVPQRHQTAADLLRTADQALYQAKRAGRNRIVAADHRPEGTGDDGSAPAG